VDHAGPAPGPTGPCTLLPAFESGPHLLPNWECEQVAKIRATEFEVLVHCSLTSYILGPSLCIYICCNLHELFNKKYQNIKIQ
jgi:hypothetical protein